MTTKYMDIKEFVQLGFLQETNRLFFHPHGLALTVEMDDNGSYSLVGVQDARDDPEGMAFSEETMNSDIALIKAINVRLQLEKHYDARCKLFGSYLQPIKTGE